MQVLVTRPIDDAKKTAAKLEALGHEPILCPLLTIRPLDGPQILLQDIAGLLVTSANGIRAFAARSAVRDIPVYAVGAQSAAEARALGFSRVKHSDGDARALAQLVAASVDPGHGILLHAAGADRRGGLADRLRADGFRVREDVLYEAVAERSFAPAAWNALRERHVGAVLLFSPRSAKIFRDLIERNHLAAACQEMLAVCISAATADAFKSLQFRDIRIAAYPHEDALLALLS